MARFTVVGAGLSGPLMACYLAKAGHDVELWEKRPDPRAGDADAGRSINLALSTRGIRALEEVGAGEAVMATVTPMRGRMMHGIDGSTTYQAYGTQAEEVINSVSRLGLNKTLLDLAEQKYGVTVHFDFTCEDVDLDTGVLTMRQNATGAIETVTAEHTIACDGVNSAVRRRMQTMPRFDYDQVVLDHGYKELRIPAAADGSHALRPDCLHIWPRGNFMMIALGNLDGSFTCTLFWPFDGPHSFSAMKDDGDVEAFFKKMFPDAVPLMPDLVEDYRENPTSVLMTIRCKPWYVGDKFALVGDAAHAVVPFYGQGMNCSFEDCRILAEMLDKHGEDIAGAFKEYGDTRKPDADALRDLALDNFIEMRDLVASRWFLFKKALGKLAHKLMPKTFVPLYSLVTFSHVPYAEAKARSERQVRNATVGVWTFVITLAIGLLLAAVRG